MLEGSASCPIYQEILWIFSDVIVQMIKLWIFSYFIQAFLKIQNNFFACGLLKNPE